METEVVNKNNVSVAVIHSDEHLITDVQSALAYRNRMIIN